MLEETSQGRQDKARPEVEEVEGVEEVVEEEVLRGCSAALNVQKARLLVRALSLAPCSMG